MPEKKKEQTAQAELDFMNSIYPQAMRNMVQQAAANQARGLQDLVQGGFQPGSGQMLTPQMIAMMERMREQKGLEHLVNAANAAMYETQNPPGSAEAGEGGFLPLAPSRYNPRTETVSDLTYELNRLWGK